VVETAAGYFEYDFGWANASTSGSLTVNGFTLSVGGFDASVVQSYLSALDGSVQVTGGCVDLGINDSWGSEEFSGSFTVLFKTPGAITSSAFSAVISDANNGDQPLSGAAGAGIAEVQTIPVPTGTGTFKIAWTAAATGPLAWNITQAAMATALNALSDISAAGGVSVSGSDGGPWVVTWNIAGPRTLLTCDASGLKGG
jgi:hypothetical protein